MTKKLNKVASFATAAVMTFGGLGLAKLLTKSTMVYASTDMVSEYVQNSTGEIKNVGKEFKTTVTVSSNAPATLTFGQAVDAGQYIMVAKVTAMNPQPEEDYWLDLFATVSDDLDEEGNPLNVYFSQNEYLNAFVGNVTLTKETTIDLGTWSGYTLTVDVWLQPLEIGQLNDYYLSDVRVSSETSRDIVFTGTTGVYVVIAETYDKLEGKVIEVNGTKLVKNPDMFNAYTGRVELTAGDTLTLSTTNPKEINVNLSLKEYVRVTTPLPTTEAAAATFEIYETKDFYYFSVGQSGYYTIDFNSTVANAEFSLMVKTDPNNYTGITIQGENYPVYLQQYTQYYVSVTYMGIPWEYGEESPATAKAWFSVNGWTAPTLELDKDLIYVPVTGTGASVEKVAMDVAAGKYDVNLVNIPFEILYGEYTITAHWGENSQVLEYGSAEITINGETSIWFTTDYASGFVAGLALNTIVEQKYMYLNTWEEITVPAYGSITYYIDNLAAGYFDIALKGTDQVQVDASTFGYPVISAGQTSGTFFVYAYGDETATVSLMFNNYSGEEIKFEALVTPANNAVIELGEVKGIELATGESEVYYLENLAEGVYNVTLVGGADVEVTANGMELTDGRYVVYYDGESVALRFTNNGTESAVFTVTATQLSNGIIEVGFEKYVYLDGENNVKTYFVEGLEEGKEYKVTLPDYATDVTVMMGETVVIAAGSTTGTFTATGASVTLTFVYIGADGLFFSVNVALN
ncbi:MAG: hypothetical protein J1G05_05410 [Clostridiales bacterium]|nr:hypothetical protein [Clostridiales bacterium]